MPKLLEQLSEGHGVSSPEIQKIHKFTARSVSGHLRSLQDNMYEDYIRYDGSTKRWITNEVGFLHKELLDTEEIVVLNSMIRNQNKLGESLASTHTKIVKNYIALVKKDAYQRQTSETLTAEMEKTFALLKRAIKWNRVVTFEYTTDKGATSSRRVYPYRVYFIEYYWFLVAFEEGKKIKTFHLSSIHSAKMEEDKFDYDFELVQKRLDIAMNAYIDFDEPEQVVEILVEEATAKHVLQTSFFNAWNYQKDKYPIEIEYKGKKETRDFLLFHVSVTNADYDDIIPTILKNMPWMLVQEPRDLKEKIDDILESYKKAY